MERPLKPMRKLQSIAFRCREKLPKDIIEQPFVISMKPKRNPFNILNKSKLFLHIIERAVKKILLLFIIFIITEKITTKPPIDKQVLVASSSAFLKIIPKFVSLILIFVIALLETDKEGFSFFTGIIIPMIKQERILEIINI